MKKVSYVARISLIIILISFIISFGFGGTRLANGNVASASGEQWMQNRMIAHAMGSVGGMSYTNSYEAFMTNYNRGYRLFEVDLMMTLDGKVVAKHGWTKKIQPDLPVKSGHKPTLAQFKDALIYGEYQPLSWEDIVSLMAKYPDVYVILDTKETDIQKVKAQFAALVSVANIVDPAIMQRVIPEIFNPEMYDAVMEIYPFPHKIYSLYKTLASADSIVAYVKAKHITAVAMPVSRTIVNPTLIQRLNKLGVKSYVHTVNNTMMMNGLQEIGAYGFYTDAPRGPDKLLALLKNGDRSTTMPLLCILLICVGIQWKYTRMSKRTKNRLKVTKYAEE
ncbi:phosphatidylinositol-specific phospholipase C/glycerophosphodiester phosphodiesterase family protein [Cohnella terricola]|nr:phosphatidylinositol-specific phospholipase C/glycerophosphodiester phosphodiesterase family protein [Cohnella terricola]